MLLSVDTVVLLAIFGCLFGILLINVFTFFEDMETEGDGLDGNNDMWE